MNIPENMALFQELVSCGNDLYTWCYDATGQLLHSNCPQETLLGTAFSLLGCKEQMLSHAQEHDHPIALGSAIGLIWAAAYEKEDGELKRIYTIGPAFFSELSLKSVENALNQYPHLEFSVAWRQQFMEILSHVPVAQNIVFSRYALMLHYCLTGEKLNVSDLNFHAALESVSAGSTGLAKDRHKVWMTEQAMLHMVRTGNLNYKSALDNSILISNGVPVQGADPLRQAKDSLIVFASIVCRAAIDGGLSPEEAYSLGDSYIQSTENARTFSDLAALAPVMYDDFVQRVHKCRVSPRLSRRVQKCCDYIQIHLESKVTAKDLARLVGYTEYYLTRKFKEETGLFINDYIKEAKIERAKLWLTSSDYSIQEISDKLGFSSRSYFSRVFREGAGCTPVEYRASWMPE